MCFKKVFGSFYCSKSQDIIKEHKTKVVLDSNNYELLHKLNLEDGYIYRHYKKIINKGATTPLKFRLLNLLYLLPMIVIILIGFVLFLIFLISTITYLYESQMHDGSENDIITATISFLLCVILLISSCGAINLWKRSLCMRISFVSYSAEFVHYGPNYACINYDEESLRIV